MPLDSWKYATAIIGALFVLGDFVFEKACLYKDIRLGSCLFSYWHNSIDIDDYYVVITQNWYVTHQMNA